MKRIGEDLAEKLDYVPGVFTVARHVRGKCACAQCETIVQAPVAPHVIDKRFPLRGCWRRCWVSNGMDAPTADGIDVPEWQCHQPLEPEGASAMQITTVGLDLAKNVFQVHGANGLGKAVLRKQLRREQVAAFVPPCLVGMEACGSAHHWARKLHAMGNTVKLMAPQFVKPYVKSNKNDAADAEAICKAVGRPSMWFDRIKNIEQQAVLALHRVRQGFIKARTAQANQIRGLLGEFGLIVPQGIAHVSQRVVDLIEDASVELAGSFRILVQRLLEHLKLLHQQVEKPKPGIARARLPPPGEGAGHRSADGQCTGCDRWRRRKLRQRAPVRCMVVPGSAAVLQRRQAEPAWHEQTRRRVLAHVADSRRPIGNLPRHPTRGRELADRAHRSAKQEHRRRGAG